MDKESIALVIAQNGLETAAAMLLANAAQKQKQAAKLKDGDPNKAKLIHTVEREQTLAKALRAADTGIAAYLTPDTTAQEGSDS